jgi:hypothetical protein
MNNTDVWVNFGMRKKLTGRALADFETKRNVW